LLATFNPREKANLTKLTQWGINLQLRTVAETPLFCRQADKLFNEAERRKLISLLASNPFAGVEIPGTGGVRKLRFATQGQGKRGGARIIYFHVDDQMPVYALLAYAKSAKTDMTDSERQQVSKLATAIKAMRKEKT